MIRRENGFISLISKLLRDIKQLFPGRLLLVFFYKERKLELKDLQH